MNPMIRRENIYPEAAKEAGNAKNPIPDESYLLKVKRNGLLTKINSFFVLDSRRFGNI
jgi:hypothetical protein